MRRSTRRFCSANTLRSSTRTRKAGPGSSIGIDGYVGYVPTNALAQPGPPPTHRVTALRTFLYPGPSIKLPPLAVLSIGSRLSVMREDGRFLVTPDGFVFSGHVGPIDAFEPDFVAVAERFLGTPYHWGGRTSIGVDCSGLVHFHSQPPASPRRATATCRNASRRTTPRRGRTQGAPPGRPRVLEGPCGHAERRTHAAACDRPLHGCGQRAADGRAGSHHRGRLGTDHRNPPPAPLRAGSRSALRRSGRSGRREA